MATYIGALIFNDDVVAWQLKKLETRYDSLFEIEGIKGNLYHGIAFNALTIRASPELTINLKNVKASFNLSALLLKRLDIKNLSAQQVLIKNNSAQQSSDIKDISTLKFPVFETPVQINIQQLSALKLEMINASDDVYAVSDIHLRATLKGHRITISHLALKQNTNTLSLDGSFDLSDKTFLDIKTQINMTKEVQEQDHTKLQLQVSAHLQGYYPQMSLDLEGDALLNESPIAKDSICQIKTNMKEVDLTSCSLNSFGAIAKLNGKASLYPQQHAQLMVNINEIRPEIYFPNIKGNISVALPLKMKVENENLNIKLEKGSLSGWINQEKIKGALSAQWLNDSGELHLSSLTLGQSKATLVARKKGPDIHAVWQVNIPDVSVFNEGIQGQFNGKTTLLGTFEQPEVQSYLTIQDFSYKNLTLNKLSINAKGNMYRHEIKLSSEHKKGSGDITAIAGLTLKNYHITDIDGFYRHDTLGQWRIKQPATIVLTPQQLKLEQQCWVQDNKKFCYDGYIDRKGYQADITVAAFPIHWIKEYHHLPVEAEGALDMKVQLSTTELFALPKGTIDASIAPLNLKISSSAAPNNMSSNSTSAKDTIVNLDQFKLNVVLDQELKTNSSMYSEALQTQAQFDAVLPTVESVFELSKLLELPLEAKGFIESSDLSKLMVYAEGLETDFDQIQGNLRTQLSIKGSINQPLFSSETKISSGNVFLKKAHLPIKNLTINIDQQLKNTNIQATATVGSGTAQLNSSLKWGEGFVKTFSTFNGQNITLIDRPFEKLVVSPKLNVSTHNKDIQLKGEVLIPFSRFERKKKFTRNDLEIVSDDQQIIQSQEKEKVANDFNLISDVTLIFKDDVLLSLYGLEANIDGQVNFTNSQPNKQETRGVVNLTSGRYQAYGQDLVVRKGVLHFLGPIDRPGIDIEAVRIINDELTVGIRAKGLIDELSEFTLFSEPAGLSQTELLSYLIKGEGLNNADEQQADYLRQASLILALGAGRYLKDQVKGLDYFDTISLNHQPGSGTEQTMLTLGKYLSPKLYLSYGFGLFESISNVKLRYKLNNNLEFVTESSQELKSADFILKFEQ